MLTLSQDEFLRRFLLHVLPKASCAFATSDSSPTGDAPRSCHFAFICSAQHSRQSKTYPAAKTRVIFALPKMWCTDAGHREAYCCRDPTPFLHLSWSLLPHESTLYSTKPLRVPARSVSLRLVLLQICVLPLSPAISSQEFCTYLTLSSLTAGCSALSHSPANLGTAPSHN